jgi:hypothetical protein
MTLKSKKSAPLFAAALALMSAFAAAETPKGWIKAGSAPQLYDVGVERDGKTNAAYIVADKHMIRKVGATEGFGTLMQTISASEYAGKRVRFAADVAADSIEGWAGLWMRVDGAQGKVLAFDNMQKNPIAGTSDAKRYAVVLDVPAAAQTVSFGILLNGMTGRAAISDVRLETVGKDVPATSGAVQEPPPTKPRNLGFSE